MPEETTQTSTETTTTTPPNGAPPNGTTSTGTPAKDAHLEQAIRERNAAKAKSRELENQIAEMRSRLDAVDQEKQERENDLARKSGEFGKVEESYKEKLSAKDKALADANAKLEAIVRGQRETAMVETVAAKAGLEPGVVRGLLRVAADSGFDSAPTEITESIVAEAIEKMRVLAPSLFKTRSTPAHVPGTNINGEELPPEYANDEKAAKAYLAGRSLSPMRAVPKE